MLARIRYSVGQLQRDFGDELSSFLKPTCDRTGVPQLWLHGTAGARLSGASGAQRSVVLRWAVSVLSAQAKGLALSDLAAVSAPFGRPGLLPVPARSAGDASRAGLRHA